MWGEQRKFIEAWAYQIVREPRMAALLEESAVKLLAKAESILKDTSSESQRQTFTLVSFLLLPNYIKTIPNYTTTPSPPLAESQREPSRL